MWKSEPANGEAIGPEEMATLLANYLKATKPQQSAEHVRGILASLGALPESVKDTPKTARDILADALTIISVDFNSKARA